MPTLEDLHDALAAREVHAGDPVKVQRYVLDRHNARPSRRRYLAPTIAAAAVAGLAITAAVIGVTRSSGDGHAAHLGSGQMTTHPAGRKTGTPNVAVPADALRWRFTFDPLPGFTFSYGDYHSGQQSAEVTSTSKNGIAAGVSVFAPGAFDPSSGSVDGTAVRGASVSVNGHHGFFVAGPSTPTLFWAYAADSWASVSLNGTVGTRTGSGAKNVQSVALRIAQAVRVRTSGPVTLPFRLADTPTRLKIVDVTSDPSQSSIMYGTSFDAADGTYLIVSRWSSAQNNLGLKKALGAATAGTSGNRVITRTLADGSTLVVAVQAGHLDDISRSRQQAITDGIDVTPTLDNPDTWLPVTG